MFYHGRALSSHGGSMIAAAIGVALFFALGIFIACALPYVLNLPR